MTRDDPQTVLADTERLRSAFAARRVSVGDAACPEATELFDAAQGQLPALRMEAVIDHVTRCAACAEAWRLLLEADGAAVAHAHDMADGHLRPEPFKRANLFNRRYLAPLAAAAGVVLAVGLLVNYLPNPQLDDPQYRATAAADVPQSLVGDSLPRAQLLLRWSGSGAAARYTLRVMTTSLEPVLIQEDLRETEYLVPMSAIAGVAADSDLLWQVEVVLPGGRHETSPSYVLRVR